jgi:ATP-dependent Lhr-like helicase
MFGLLLRDLGEREVLAQTHDGTIVLGLAGERLVNHYDFYSAFMTFEEYRLVSGPRTLGTLPISRPLAVGDLLLFAGRRWRVLEVRDVERVVELEPAPAGRAPSFVGGAAAVDDAIRTRMLDVYLSDDHPEYLDATGRELLDEGRRAFLRLRLDVSRTLQWGESVVLFPWVGDTALDTLALMLRREGVADAARDGLALLAPQTSVSGVISALDRATKNRPEEVQLAGVVANIRVEKHHDLLGERLLIADYASSRLNVNVAMAAARALVQAD